MKFSKDEMEMYSNIYQDKFIQFTNIVITKAYIMLTNIVPKYWLNQYVTDQFAQHHFIDAYFSKVIFRKE